MREIMFRGKLPVGGGWHIGHLYKKNGKFNIRDDSDLSDLEVIPETVGQYIGLKDEAGRWIFEGDIVRGTARYNKDVYGVVEFHTENIGSCGCCYGDFVGSGFAVFGLDLTENIKIVGNIYDNPEILEALHG